MRISTARFISAVADHLHVLVYRQDMVSDMYDHTASAASAILFVHVVSIYPCTMFNVSFFFTSTASMPSLSFPLTPIILPHLYCAHIALTIPISVAHLHPCQAVERDWDTGVTKMIHWRRWFAGQRA